jgi:hypothetical protein
MAAEDCVTDLLTDIGAARDGHRRLLLAHLRPSAMSAFAPLLEDERTHLGHHGIDALDPEQA